MINEFITHASGSSGNLYEVRAVNGALMVEAGISFKKAREAFSFKLSGVDGCIITHEHRDHSHAAKHLIEKGVDVYMTQGTADAVGLKKSHRLHIIRAWNIYQVGSFRIYPFPAVHDAAEPVNYLIFNGYDYILYITDTMYVPFKFKIPRPYKLICIAIEANYRDDLLSQSIQENVFPRALRRRVKRNHMSIDTARRCIMEKDLSNVREIHLIHLSGTNSDPASFCSMVAGDTGKPVYVAGKGI